MIKSIPVILIVVMLAVIVTSIDPNAVQAGGPYKQGNTFQLLLDCSHENGTICSPGTLCNITRLQYPDGSLLFSNRIMNGTPFLPSYNITINDTSRLGVYEGRQLCCDGLECGSRSFFYKVTYTGTDPNGVQLTIYIMGLMLFILLFVIGLIASVSIPFKDKRDAFGRIIAVNYLKNLKILAMFFTYVCLIFIFYLGWTLQRGFLDLNPGYNIFKFGYLTLMFGLKIMWPIIGVFWIIWFIHDNKVSDMINRGLKPR